VNLANVQAAERKRQREEAAADITVLFRPKKEAGSTTKGFNLQESMGLNDNGPLYNDILVCHNHEYQGNVMGD
jgi:hypothetical protein